MKRVPAFDGPLGRDLDVDFLGTAWDAGALPWIPTDIL
jgi:hypothetical protein